MHLSLCNLHHQCSNAHMFAPLVFTCLQHLCSHVCTISVHMYQFLQSAPSLFNCSHVCTIGVHMFAPSVFTCLHHQCSYVSVFAICTISVRTCMYAPQCLKSVPSVFIYVCTSVFAMCTMRVQMFAPFIKYA